MSQWEIDKAVAKATGEGLAVIESLGFSLADPLEVAYDPDSRRPLALDWDSMCPSEWPE